MNSWNRLRGIAARLKDLTTIGTANSVSALIMGLFWFFLASLLGTESYGEISYFIAIASIVYTVSFLGAGATITVYTSKEKKTQSSVFFVSIISSIITSLVLFFVFYNIGLSLFVIGNAIFALALGDLLGRKLYPKYSKYLIIQKIFLVGFSIALYYVMGPQGVILGFALSFFPFIPRVARGLKESKIDMSIIKRRFPFMMNVYGLNLSRSFTMSADKLIIAPLFGFALLGNYHLGFQFLMLLSILPSTVYAYVLPHDASGHQNRKLKKATILASVALAIIGMSIAPLVLPFFLPDFKEAVEIIQIMSLGIIPITINLMYTSKFLGIEKSKIVLIGAIIYVAIQILGIFLLGQIYGINGAAIALVLAASSQSAYLVTADKFILKTR